MAKQKFIPLNKLLLEDNEEVKKIKSLKNREEEYAYLLGPIEETVALHFSENKKLKDRDIIRMLKNIKSNYYNELGYFKETLEREILTQLSFVLQDEKTMHHELLLAISYILWSIDNRRWTGDSRAYLEWVLSFFGMMDEKEKEAFQKKYDALGKKFGIDKEKIKVMTNSTGEFDDVYKPSEEDEAFSKKESEYFAMPDEEKCSYLLKCDDKMESSRVMIDLINQMEEYFKNGSFSKVINIADKIKDAKIEKGMREIIYSMKAEALICMNEHEKAERAAQELITFSNNYPMGYFHLAVIRFKDNDLRGALEILDKTIEVAEKADMRHPQHYQLKADVLKKLNDPDYNKFEETAKKLAKENLSTFKKLSEEIGLDDDLLDEFDKRLK